MTKDFDELLGKLQEHHAKANVDIFIPSTQSNSPSKKITVEQQSLLLTGALTQETRKNVFSYNRVISEIILKNLTEPETINLVDKIPIAIQYRVDTIGETIILNGDIVNLNNHIQSVYPGLKQSIEEVIQQHEYTTDTGVSIVYSCPPLYMDYDVNSSAEKKWAELQGEDIIAELFKVELSKYIQQVSFDDETINVSTLDFDSRIKVCDSLPMSCTRKLVDFIEQVKDIENVYVNLSGHVVPMDATLFGA